MEKTANILEIDIKSRKSISDPTQSNDKDSGINSAGSESSEEFYFYYHQKETFPISILKDFTLVNLKPGNFVNLKSNIEDGNWILTKPQNLKKPLEAQPQTFVLLPGNLASSGISSDQPLKFLSKKFINNAKNRKKYRNTTTERRMQANARERTRVHTISAAYDNLRRAIPSYSNLQKMSKLSVLRVATAYILTLARLTTNSETESDISLPPLASYFAALTATIQFDGKLHKDRERFESL